MLGLTSRETADLTKKSHDVGMDVLGKPGITKRFFMESHDVPTNVMGLKGLIKHSISCKIVNSQFKVIKWHYLIFTNLVLFWQHGVVKGRVVGNYLESFLLDFGLRKAWMS